MPKKKASSTKPVEEAASKVVHAELDHALLEAPSTGTRGSGALDQGTLKILTDLVEWEVEMIFNDRASRRDRWTTLNVSC
jgi:hypothetical protein